MGAEVKSPSSTLVILSAIPPALGARWSASVKLPPSLCQSPVSKEGEELTWSNHLLSANRVPDRPHVDLAGRVVLHDGIADCGDGGRCKCNEGQEGEAHTVKLFTDFPDVGQGWKMVERECFVGWSERWERMSMC